MDDVFQPKYSLQLAGGLLLMYCQPDVYACYRQNGLEAVIPLRQTTLRFEISVSFRKAHLANDVVELML